MPYVISVFSLIVVLSLTLPREMFYKRDILKNIIRHNDIAGLSHVKHENKLLDMLISFSRRISRIIPIKPSDSKIEKTEKNIQYAGLQGKITARDFIAMKWGISFLSSSYFIFLFILEPGQLMLLLTITVAAMGYMIPDNWLAMRVKNRRLSIEMDVPSVLSALAIVTDAGLNLMQAIEEVTARNTGEFTKELRKTLEDLKIGISQKDAFEKLSERCNIEEVSLFVSALIQGLEKGNSGITALIRSQARESWEKRKHKAKELAEKASMKLFMPLLLLVLPAFVIFLLGPMIFSLVKMF